MNLPARWRKALLAVHVATTVSVLGADLALLTLAISGLFGSKPQALYPAAHLVGARLLAPLAVGSLGTGLLLGILTPWGLLKYWWVTIKLAITVVLTAAVLFVLVPRLGAAAAAPAMEASTDPQRLPLVIAPVVASTLLVLSVVLAIFKPGWRLRSQPSE